MTEGQNEGHTERLEAALDGKYRGRADVLDVRPYRSNPVAATWDVHPDGDSFLFVSGRGAALAPYQVRLNATARPSGR